MGFREYITAKMKPPDKGRGNVCKALSILVSTAAYKARSVR